MLDERKAAILRTVVKEYIKTAQPVGSGAVAAATTMSVSSATIRNDMAALENEGFLHQPHTSAGRVPTDLGYRYFVDNISEIELPETESIKVVDFFQQIRGELEHLLKDTAGLLSNMTDYAAVVIDHSTDSATVRSFQLVSLAPTVALGVVVLSNGVISKDTVQLQSDVSEADIASISRAVAGCLEGHALTEPGPLRILGEPDLDLLAERVLAAVSGAAGELDHVYVDGAARVASSFDAVDSVQRVLTILEQQLVVVNVMTDVLDRGLRVAIGSETGVEPLEECSVVVAPFQVDGEEVGSIGVLGPTRMNYPQAIAAVAVVSGQLGRRLSEG